MNKTNDKTFLRNNILKAITLFILITLCSFCLCACMDNQTDKKAENIITSTISNDNLSERISFGKKYYSIGYGGYTQNQYYTFNQNGSATYNHIMKNGETTTFHQIINFKWTYLGDGELLLMHNGTKMVKGEQDDAFGIMRIMHVGKDGVYWTASGENTYFINEDFVSQIPNYAKII